MNYIGDFLAGEVVNIPFNTFDSNGASITVTNLVAGDVHIHKDAGTTQRSSSAGITVSIDFDSITGCHMIAIDTSDNTDAGFYSTASEFSVRLEGITVDTQTLNPWIGTFSIQNRYMRGTDSAFLASSAPSNFSDMSIAVTTGIVESNVTQIGGTTQSATDLKDFADSGYDPSTNKVQGVVLVDTTTTNTDMRGTDSANTVIPPTEAQMNARTIPTADYFDPAVDVVARVTLTDTTTTNTDMRGTNSALTDKTGFSLSANQSGVTIGTCTTNTDMRGTDGANTVVPPTELQMNARTIPTADYFDPANDTVARVTLTDTTTTNTDMRGTDSALTDKTGFSLSSAGIDAILDEVLTDLANTDIDSGSSITMRKALRAVFNRFFRRVTQTSTIQTVYNDSNVAIADMSVSDDGTTQTKATT